MLTLLHVTKYAKYRPVCFHFRYIYLYITYLYIYIYIVLYHILVDIYHMHYPKLQIGIIELQKLLLTYKHSKS